MSHIIRTRCPNGCKYKSGDTCAASERPYQTGDVRYDIRLNAEDKSTKINAEVKQAVKEIAEKLKEKSFYIQTAEDNYHVVELSTADAILKEYEKL